MPSAARTLAASALFALVAGLAVARQEPKAAAPQVKPLDAKEMQEKYRAERGQAGKGNFPAEAFARADDLAKRAEAALAANDPRAARYFRDARWQLPYQPASLPPHVVRVLGESRMRHPQRVNAVAYSPDGLKLASASADGTVKVWDLGNGREAATYRGHIDQAGDASAKANVFKVSDVAFSPDGKVAASASGSEVHLWEPDTGKQVKVLVKITDSPFPVRPIAFRPDGKFLAVGSDDGLVRTFEVETGKAAFTSPKRNARIECLAYSPNGNLIAVGDSTSQVAVYAPAAMNPLAMGVAGGRTDRVDLGGINGVAFTADSAGVFSCSKEGIVQLVAGPNPDGTSAANTSTRVREFVGHPNDVNALAVVTGGKILVTAGSDRTVRAWDIGSGKPLRSFQGHMSKVVAVTVRGDGKQIASAGDDGAIRLWDLNTVDEHKVLADAGDALWAVAFSPDGKRVATAGADKAIRVYGADGGKPEMEIPAAHASAITSLVYLQDGKVATAGGDRVVKVWDVAGKKATAELPGHESAVLGLAASADGKLIASAAADRTVRGWDVAAGKQAWAWTGKSAACTVAIRPGGKHVAAGTADGSLVVLDVSEGTPKELFAQPAHIAGVSCVAYSPDGNRAATVGGDGAVRVWTVAAGGGLVLLAKFDGQAKAGGVPGFSPLTGLAFSPDGRLVATVGADTVVRVWDIQTKAEIRGLRGHTDWATAVAFSPDGQLLASAGVDKTARVFELPRQEATAGGHILKANAIAVSADGSLAVTASIDQTMKIWEIATGREVATLIGNADEPLAVTFLGNDGLVLGGRRDGNPSVGQLHFWGAKVSRHHKSVPTGAVYTVAAVADGSKAAAWMTRPAAAGPAHSAYEVYDREGNLVTSVPDKGRSMTAGAFSADLTWAAGGDDQGTVRLWDLATKERVGADWPIFANAVGDLGLTPDRRFLVAIDAKGLAKVADVKTRETLGSVQAHAGGVRGLVVSPKGDTFVTFSTDREVKVWSLADPKAVKEVRGWSFGVAVNSAAYTPDGKRLLTANADGTAFVLELP